MRQIIHAILSVDWYRLKGWQTTVALKRDWRLRTSTVLRCVRNPANPSGMRHTPSFLTRHVGSNIPRTASVEAKAGPKPEVETETNTRAKGCCARREGRRLRWKEADAVSGASFRVELSSMVWVKSFPAEEQALRAPTTEHRDFLREPIRRTFDDFRDVTHSDDRQCRTCDWDLKFSLRDNAPEDWNLECLV